MQVAASSESAPEVEGRNADAPIVGAGFGDPVAALEAWRGGGEGILVLGEAAPVAGSRRRGRPR